MNGLPVHLDLFGCEGGMASGLASHLDVWSVEIDPNRAKYNPHSWYVGDWKAGLEIALSTGLVRSIGASPPCQGNTGLRHLAAAQGTIAGRNIPFNQLRDVRHALIDSGLPYYIENVPQSPLRPDLTLCGSMFGLQVQRHRIFETNCLLYAPGPCAHDTFPIGHKGKPRPWGVYGSFGDDIPEGGHTARTIAHGAELLGVQHPMTGLGLRECLPPAYGRWIGAQLALHGTAAA